MFEQFRNKFPLDDEKWNRYVGCFQQMAVPAKTILLQEGEVSRKLFLVEKGCLRAWYNLEGKEITLQFFFEKNTVASLESFRKEIPSPITIETLENSMVWWIAKQDLNLIITDIKEIPLLRDQLIDLLFERTFDYMKHFFSFLKDSPAQRYLKLLQEEPQVVQRVPQHYIASYLGISSVHLSRIKSKLAKGGKAS